MLFASAALGGALCTSTALAQTKVAGAEFKEPTRLKAGDALLGEKRLFPSPVFQDINGDGLPDIVVGDLRGKMTVALCKPGKDGVAYGPEAPLLDVDGKEIDFHNW
jgi:hypothetical protein